MAVYISTTILVPENISHILTNEPRFAVYRERSYLPKFWAFKNL